MELTLDLEEELYQRLAAKSKSLGFAGPEEYVKHLLDQRMNKDVATEEKIAKKLKDLGYM